MRIWECDLFIAVTKEYERIRNDPLLFGVVGEHVILDIEQIVTENDRFTIVEKRQGTPAEVAIRTDPRVRPLLPLHLRKQPEHNSPQHPILLAVDQHQLRLKLLVIVRGFWKALRPMGDGRTTT